MDYKDFGARVRKVRRARNLTLETLAKMVEISPSFLGHIERGTRIASMGTLIAICNELHVSPEYLLRGNLSKYMPPTETDEAARLRAKALEILRHIEQLAEED